MPVEKVSPSFLTAIVGFSIVGAVANAITFKRLLNKYRSTPSPQIPDHNYEFFVNQFNVFIYVFMCLVIVASKAIAVGPRRWLKKQNIPWKKFVVMGLLDAGSGFMSTIGGAYCEGSLQTLLNQCIIPGTIILSYFFLGEKVSLPQGVGSLGIVLGAVVSVIPSLLYPSATSTTTAKGVVIFICGLVPAAASNVYKEAAFRSEGELKIDINLLSAIVATFQVIAGFLFLPVLSLKEFGGVPLKDMPEQLRQGFMCFLNQDSLPGDHCSGKSNHPWAETGFSAMILYCVVNFGYNLLSLLVTKWGSAVLMVVSSALALPVTNLAFSTNLLMGKRVEPFTVADAAALLLVGLGFLLYSSGGLGGGANGDREAAHAASRGEKAPLAKPSRLLPLQQAGGSMLYIRERSNSEPNLATPTFTPRFTTARSPRGELSPITGTAAFGYQALGTYPLQIPAAARKADIEMVSQPSASSV
jgi:drug/metabolite transporter (DMT)-like permease